MARLMAGTIGMKKKAGIEAQATKKRKKSTLPQICLQSISAFLK